MIVTFPFSSNSTWGWKGGGYRDGKSATATYLAVTPSHPEELNELEVVKEAKRFTCWKKENTVSVSTVGHHIFLNKRLDIDHHALHMQRELPASAKLA